MLAKATTLYDSIQPPASLAVESAAGADRLRLLLSFEQPLLHEALLALARRDERFLPILPAANNSSADEPLEPCVVLLDGACTESRIRPLVKRFCPAGGVLLTNVLDSEAVGPARFCGVKMAVLDYHANWSCVSKALSLAAKGHYETTASSDQLDGTEHDVAPAETEKCVADDLHRFALLTRREKEVLTGIGRGCSPQQIAEHLQIAVSTVENHKSRLMKKTDIHKSIELVRFAIRVGAAPV